MKKTFYKFLEKNGCLEAFKNNLPSDDYIDKNLRRVHPANYVSTAFVWSKTEQGHDYWSKIDLEWRSTTESARRVYPKTTIEDFAFRPAGYGRYKVTYSSPTTGESWSRTIDDMPLIDATKNADEPKRKDLNILKRKCKGL